MSKFSGKCDLYDSVVAIGGYDIKNIELFIMKNNKSYPLKLNEPRDLIPYYPYVPCMSSYMGGKYKAWINESFIDTEEKERLEFDLEELLREYRRAKRKKIEFKPNGNWYYKEIIERVKEQGEKATIEGLHLPLHNHYRKSLAEEMEKNGYTDYEIIQWVYPERWLTQFDWHNEDY